VAIHRLFESLEIKWKELKGPSRTHEESSGPARPIGDGAPSLARVRESDLRCVSSLELLYDQAVHRGHLRDSEAGFIRFASTAAYCLRVGDDPAALFAYLVRAGEYPATLEDEDRALASIKEARSAARKARRWLVIREEP